MKTPRGNYQRGIYDVMVVVVEEEMGLERPVEEKKEGIRGIVGIGRKNESGRKMTLSETHILRNWAPALFVFDRRFSFFLLETSYQQTEY